MKILKIVSGASALILLAVSCGNKQKSMQETTPPQYPTTIVGCKNTELLSEYPVTIKGQEDIEIRPRIDGFIDAIYIDEGAVVKKGQVLFKINSPQADQALTTTQAAFRSAKAQVNIAKTNVERIRPLAEQNIVSKVQLTTAEDSYQSALAGLEQAEAALRNAKATVGWTNVSSPVNGLIGSIPFRKGSLVNSSDVLTTVANTGRVYAYFSLNEKDLSNFLDELQGNNQTDKIRNSPEVSLNLADGRVYENKGKIETITGSINITTGSAVIRAAFPNTHGILRSGTSGKIFIPKYIEKAIVIPQKSTFAQQDKIIVFKVQGDSVIQTPITVLPTPDGKKYVVTGGLKEGERIVTDGIATLSQGKKIIFK